MGQDENTRYVCIGPLNKVMNMLCCWIEDPDSLAFKKCGPASPSPFPPPFFHHHLRQVIRSPRVTRSRAVEGAATERSFLWVKLKYENHDGFGFISNFKESRRYFYKKASKVMEGLVPPPPPRAHRLMEPGGRVSRLKACV